MTETRKDQDKTLFDLFNEYNLNPIPASYRSYEHLDDIPQDIGINSERIRRSTSGEYPPRSVEAVKNVRSNSPPFSRENSYFSLFLDGCRRAYYLCDIASASGSLLPIMAGQISSAVVQRDRENGKISLNQYVKKGLLLLPHGGRGLNSDDANNIKNVIDSSFQHLNIEAKLIKMKNDEKPQNDALTHLNMEMQNLEILLLEQLVHKGIIDQRNMIIVDGALQFQRIDKEKISHLRYAVGLSKNFNHHLKIRTLKNREVGSVLTKLKEVGDRTVAFKLKIEGDAKEYAFWYLRIRSSNALNYPLAGIVKLEKVLVTEEERESGLSADLIDNISRCVLLETSCSAYGLDFRWPSHIYPIYLTEMVQKKNFTSDYIYHNLVRHKLALRGEHNGAQ